MSKRDEDNRPLARAYRERALRIGGESASEKADRAWLGGAGLGVGAGLFGLCALRCGDPDHWKKAAAFVLGVGAVSQFATYRGLKEIAVSDQRLALEGVGASEGAQPRLRRVLRG